jgi:hypothetical protein
MAIDLSKQLVARWPEPEPGHLPLLKRIGLEAIILPPGAAPNPAFVQAATAAGIAIAPESLLGGAVTGGVWPGIRRPGRRINWDNDLFASASAEPWIDSNLYLTPLERALTGKPSPVCAYLASPETGLAADRSVPFESLEVALLEARLQGGNYVLSIEPRYRAALLTGDTKALAAWDSLGRTAAWLREQTNLFGRPAPPMLTALVEPGAASAEIANLLYRRNASPLLLPASAPLPAPDPKRILVLVAASLKTVPEAVWRHAIAGSTVVVDDTKLVRPAWRRTKEESDREFYSLGAGRVAVYRKRVADPSEFALDVIDLAGHRHRTARLWNAQSSVVFATGGPSPGQATLHVVNYGSPQTEEVQARLHGRFAQATLLRPEAPPLVLKTQARGQATEVFLPDLHRAAVIRFRA